MSNPKGKVIPPNSPSISPPAGIKKNFTWMPFLSLLISIIALTWTIVNQLKQNSRIDSLNDPKIIVDETFMQYFGTISKKQHDTTNWGYYLYAFQQTDGTYHIPFYLEVSDSNNNPFNDNYGFSIKEVKERLKEKGYTGKFTIRKIWNPIIYLKNIGPTDALNMRLNVDRKLGPYNSTPWYSTLIMDKTVDLSQNERVHPALSIRNPADYTLPDSIYFRIYVDYRNSKGDIFYHTFYIGWGQSHDSWGKFRVSDDSSQ